MPGREPFPCPTCGHVGEIVMHVTQVEAMTCYLDDAGDVCDAKDKGGAYDVVGTSEYECEACWYRWEKDEEKIVITRQRILGWVETLEHVACLFDLCPGPDKPTEDMLTCKRCALLQEMRGSMKGDGQGT